MSLKYPLNETLSPIDREGRNRLNDNWSRIMAYFDHVQLQIKALAGGHEVDELIARLEQAIANAETDLQNYIAQVDTTVQEAIDANNTATQDAIAENNTALQIALDKVTDQLLEVNQAIENADTSAEGANAAKQGALDATEQAQTAISSMRSLIDNTVHRGIWNNTTQYFKNNMVTYNGSAFIALQDNVDKTPPTLPTPSNAYWSLFAEKGGTGATGPEGRPGKDGKDGTGVNIIGSLASEAELPQTGSPGDAYMIGGDLYVWQENLNNWKNVGPIQGPEGKSAYDLAVQNGFVGTMEEWLESLKGEVGPPGPPGEKGEPGQDADLTEINQKVDDLQTEVTEHLAEKVLSENGAHGIRYFNDKLETKNGESWSEIEIGKANPRGTQSLSPNHAIRRFPVFSGWANDTTAESLWLVMDDLDLRGQFIVRGAIGNTEASNDLGGFEYSLHVRRAIGSNTQEPNSPEILYYSTYMSSRFIIGSQATIQQSFQPVLPITKRRFAAPLYIEIEYMTVNGNAFDVLDSIEFQLQSPQAAPNTDPQQVSLFTHVGNSKTDLATAITGKGVATSADDTFAQMVANIDTISTGAKTATGTVTTSGTALFSYADSSGSTSLAKIALEFLFKPKLIYLYYNATTSVAYVSVYNSEREKPNWSTGTTKVFTSNGMSFNSPSTNVTARHLSNESPFKYEIPVYATGTYNWIAYG